MIPREIRTARLVLTPPAFSDIEAIHALYDDPAVHKWAPSIPTLEDNARYYSELIPPAGLTEPEKDAFWQKLPEKQWVMRLPNSDEIIGICAIYHDGNETEIWYNTASRHRRRGYATEVAEHLTKLAFQNLPISKIQMVIFPNNEVSQGVAEKCGYTFTALLPPTKTGIRRSLYEITRESIHTPS